MSTSIVWAANGHELLKLEAVEDESEVKQRIQAAFGIPAGACRSTDPSAVLSATGKAYHILRHSLCCTCSADSVTADLQRLERREEDGAYLLYIKLRGGCRRRVGAGVTCPCFGCHFSVCSVQ